MRFHQGFYLLYVYMQKELCCELCLGSAALLVLCVLPAGLYVHKALVSQYLGQHG